MPQSVETIGGRTISSQRPPGDGFEIRCVRQTRESRASKRVRKVLDQCRVLGVVDAIVHLFQNLCNLRSCCYRHAHPHSRRARGAPGYAPYNAPVSASRVSQPATVVKSWSGIEVGGSAQRRKSSRAEVRKLAKQGNPAPGLNAGRVKVTRLPPLRPCCVLLRLSAPPSMPLRPEGLPVAEAAGSYGSSSCRRRRSD